jgi:hypothetical protein
MAITTATELRTAVQNRMGGRTDISDDQYDEFISLGEAHLNRELRLQEMQTSTTLSLSASARSVSLPSDFLEDISLVYQNNDFTLVRKTLPEINVMVDSDETVPAFYAISDKIYFEAPADQAYSLTLDYYQRWDILTDSTNTLLTNHPDCYLYSALVEGFRYTRNMEREAISEIQRDKVVQKANRLSGRVRRGERLSSDSTFMRRGGSFNITRGF